MNKLPVSIFALTTALLLASCTVMNNAELQQSRQLELNAQQLSEMHVDVGAGRLTVRGTADSDRVRVTAEVWQVQASDDYVLNLERDGKRGVLAANIDSGGGWFSGGSGDRIDLIVSVPEQLRLDIRDGSGSIDLMDVRSDVRIDDGSGSIKVRNLGGALEIEDGSGSLSVLDIRGDITINDGSGSISVRDAGGDLDIRDGSGSITVQGIVGVVRINDGSGSISVDGAADFELLSDGSGSVNTRNIGESNEQRAQ